MKFQNLMFEVDSPFDGIPDDFITDHRNNVRETEP
jgi:hypothetical protein